MSGLLGKIPRFTLRLPASLAKAGRTMSECPLELSFSLCEDASNRRVKTEELKTLQVNIPDDCKDDIQNPEIPEKADDEKSEKEDNMEVTCSVSVDGQEKQEFSFTLYDFDTKDKANKQDVEKVVVRSICEALGKTLKLPPSGSRTIKVKLAISPDSSKDIDTKEQGNEVKWPVESSERTSPCKGQDYDSSKSANTASTYLMSSGPEKPPSGSCHHPNLITNSPTLVNVAVNDVKPTASPKLRPLRHSRLVSIQRQEMKNSLKEHYKRTFNEDVLDNRNSQKESQTIADDLQNHQNHQHTHGREHLPESRERRNHYLDLAGIENDVKHGNNPSQNKSYVPSFVDPNYVCPYRILDRGHTCSKSHRTKDCPESPGKKHSNTYLPKFTHGFPEFSPCRNRIDTNTQDDLLNLNFDLCDLVPEAKFDWERIHHRRSKSYDLHQSELHHGGGIYSPKLKQRPTTAVTSENVKNPNHLNSSPAHHYRFKHRDKERQRAMQQVANWIAREHTSNKEERETHFLTGGFVKSSPSGAVEKHEHHHLHEHVHHHYYHFADF